MELYSLGLDMTLGFRLRPRLTKIMAYFGFSQHTNADSPTPTSDRRSELGPTLGTKRSGDDIFGQGRQSKRLHTRSAYEARENAKRLTGYYDVPPDARKIAIPGGISDDRETPVKSSPSMGYGKKGGFKPRNTLNTVNIHAEKALPPQQPRARGYKDYGADTLVRLPPKEQRSLPVERQPYTTSKRKPDVRSSNAPGDGFELDELRPDFNPKRPKLEMAPPLPSRPPPKAVDLTGDEGDVVVDSKVVARNGKPLSARSRDPAVRHSAISHSSSPLQFNESAAVDAKTRVPHEKPRKSRDPSSSGASPHATPAGSTNGRPTTEYQRLADVDVRPRSQQEQQSRTNGTDSREGPAAIPPINLTKGFDGHQRPAKKPGDETQLKNAGNLMDRMTSSAVKPKPRSTATYKQLERRTIPQGDSPNESNPSVKSAQLDRCTSPRLSKKFVPIQDRASAARPHVGGTALRASQRLQGMPERAEKPAPIGHDDGESSDELNGDRNIISPSTKPALQSRSRAGGEQTHQPSSPNDLRPTIFTQSSRRGLSPGPSTRRTKQITKTPSQNKRVRVREFYAASSILFSGKIELEYDAEDKLFYVFNDDKQQLIPGKGRAITLGDSEVARVFFARSRREICLRGPIGDLSNSFVCIEFENAQDVLWFAETLQTISNGRIGGRELDANQIETTFETYRINVNAEYKKRRQKQATQETTVRQAASTAGRQTIEQHGRSDRQALPRGETSRRTRASDMRNAQTDEDEIQYEDDDAPTSGQTRSAVRSQYFTNDGVSAELAPRRSVRTVRPPTPPRWTEVNKPEPWNYAVVYPTEGARRVTVDFADLERLDEGEFLNDNVISFALRKVEETMVPEHKANVHFFNTFFYTSLTAKNGKKAFNYDAVKRWTKNTDLLTVPYTVVPINDNYHWYLAIICNLNNLERKAARPGDGDDAEEDDMLNPEDPMDSSAPERPGRAGLPNPDDVTHSADALHELSLSEKGENSQTFFDMPESPKTQTSSARRRKKAAPTLKKYDADTPVIITLDSFGSQHTAAARQLKDYISAEATEKRGMVVEREEIQAMTAKGIPEQTNFCDCGVYLVGYIEEFAKNPREFVTKVLTRKLDKEADFASFDPSKKRAQIRNDLLDLYAKQDAEHRAIKLEKKCAVKVSSKPEVAGAAKQDAAPSKALAAPETPRDTNGGTAAARSGPEVDGLEMAVPRALSEAADSPPSSFEDITRNPPATANNTAVYQAVVDVGGEDEMLEPRSDNNMPRHHETVEPKEDILSKLENELQQGGQLDTLAPTFANGPPSTGKTPEARHGKKSSVGRSSAERSGGRTGRRARSGKSAEPVVIDLDSHPSLAAEIPDSQEKVEPQVQHQKQKRTYMRFNE